MLPLIRPSKALIRRDKVYIINIKESYLMFLIRLVFHFNVFNRTREIFILR